VLRLGVSVKLGQGYG